MGTARESAPVTPMLGLLFSAEAVATDALARVGAVLGAPQLTSETWPFTDTDYYTPEMGSGLVRRFFAFALPADPGQLPGWKLATNAIEAEFARGGRRVINLDPGYVDGSKLVLASTKNLAHRVYLRDGIYAEVTMTFRRGEWVKRDYTFADFSSGRYDTFFSRAREIHLARTQAAT